MRDSLSPPFQPSVLSSEDLPLSPQRAFVVQFRSPRDEGSEYLMGRVEHIASGQASRFQSLPELTQFFTQVLAQIHQQEDE